MSEINKLPKGWWWNDCADSTSLRKMINSNKGRVTAIKSFVRSNKRFFAAVWVTKEGITSQWDSNFKSADIDKFHDKKLRPVALDVYYQGSSRKCAVAWINDDGKKWNWHPEKDAAGLKAAVKNDKGYLTTVRTYVHNGKRKYSGIWLKNDSTKWDWHWDLDMDQLKAKLEKDNGRLISIDTFVKNGKRKYAAVWVKNNSQAWFWNSGLKQDEANLKFKRFCSFAMDAVPYGDKERRVATILSQYPASEFQNKVLVKSAGDATLTGLTPNLVGEFISFHLKTECVADTLTTINKINIMRLYSGGAVALEMFSPFDLGQPFSGGSIFMSPHKVYEGTSGQGSDLGSTHFLMQISAKDEKGNEQFSNTVIPILAPGKASPPALQVKSPMFIGNWTNPAEVYPMFRNGKKIKWSMIAGHFVNGTGKKMRIVTFHAKMTIGNKVVMDKDLPLDFFRHPGDKHIELKKSSDGTVLTSERLTFFIHGQEIKYTGSDTTGELTLTSHYKLDGCRFASLKIPVKIISPVTCASPVTGKWIWGNSPDHTGWDAHAWPGHRFSVDLAKKDSKGNTSKDPKKLDENDNYYCFGKPVFCMKEGVMIEAVDDFVDENGNTMNPEPNPDKHGGNHIFIRHSDNSVSAYFHLKQGSVDKSFLASGLKVPAGKKIANVGNSGTLGPHLHIGLVKLDSTGRGLFVPMQFNNMKTPGGKAIKGVPSTEEFKS